MILYRKSLLRALLAVTIVLSIPLIAMQFTAEVNWSLFDFVVMGLMVFCLVIVLEFIRSRWRNKKQLIPFIILALAAFLLLWAELSVGIFGSPIAGS
ncbi:hypothetical protein AAU57_02915 [Nonlabens sp. YIK11]|uniref:hypothetical protein n=1 Tax=Nonlabens sp. YIK11 TaxID=1453349 RepID=UPI0006DCD9F3|nr:hypothetical protein [Nonlabens sp. YIK11]KQC32395.1 hypothetical protein AAU57_02915 [Nonlabens sp. YIK11]